MIEIYFVLRTLVKMMVNNAQDNAHGSDDDDSGIKACWC